MQTVLVRQWSALAVITMTLILFAPMVAGFDGMPDGSIQLPSDDADFEQQLLLLINECRRTAGVLPLAWSNDLAAAARYHGHDMIQDAYMSYDTYDDDWVYVCPMSSRIGAYVPTSTSHVELIGGGWATAEQQFAMWTDPEHLAVLVNTTASEIGIGLAKEGSSIPHCVVDMAQVLGTYPVVINLGACESASAMVELAIHGASWFNQMRLRNDGGEWTEWTAFRSTLPWSLRPVAGLRTVYVEMRSFMSNYSTSAQITLLDGATGVSSPRQAFMELRAIPNPFNPRTTIRFDLPAAGPVRLTVCDLAGRLVRVLVEGEIPAGSHEAVWDGRDASDRAAPSGSYLARLVAGGKVEVVRMGLVR